ncbi:hypothetical protein LI036_04715 [bacterium 210917-DFI.7.65]|nr:hypothetical protein [bacterium 210917-DFI.7.65]
MSCITLLCTDHPLPPNGPKHDSEDCFSIQPLAYYRSAVEDLGLSMKPCRYEVKLHASEPGAALLRNYLSRHCSAGEQVELWYLWVGEVHVRAFRLTGSLSNLAADTLAQLEEREQTCVTLTV